MLRTWWIIHYLSCYQRVTCSIICFSSLCLFDLILYVPSTIFQLNRDGSSWVEPVLRLDKCALLKDHNVVTPVRGSYPRPLGLESSTLPLSHCAPCFSSLSTKIMTYPYMTIAVGGMQIHTYFDLKLADLY